MADTPGGQSAADYDEAEEDFDVVNAEALPFHDEDYQDDAEDAATEDELDEGEEVR